MPLSAKNVRTQLAFAKPIISGMSLKMIRRGQSKVGEIAESHYKEKVIRREHIFNNFSGAWIIPGDERRQGVILYIHGGGYTCGDIEYAAGFGAVIADKCGCRVFCPAYRLAPENKFPAALDDVTEAYEYLLSKGYSGEQITLCGESAGGGLCYSLCARLRDLHLPMPCGIIAISPWTDLTSSGESYTVNENVDPSMTKELLSFYAECYTDNVKDPMASPLFLSHYGMPPSLIFVGGDEIMLDDSVRLHKKLLESHADSKLIVTPERWHAYVLYCLDEDKKDFVEINGFLNRVMGSAHKLRWLPLDNAAKIYPAARRQNWSNLFRVSVTFTENIDVDVMRDALDVTVRRFPSFAVRLRRGVFWYRLEQLSSAPEISEEYSHPLTGMTYSETGKCAFRVIIHGRRLAVEIFHSITDGTGGMIFLKTLSAEYLSRKYGVKIPSDHGVLGRLDDPDEAELEDSFIKYAGDVAASRKERTAWHLSGTPEKGGYLNLTCLEISGDKVLDVAHSYNVSVTAFLCAAQMMALQRLQMRKVPDKRKRKPIKILLPVNLRSIFGSKTLRNFALYTTPEILPRVGEYTMDEICKLVKHHMGSEITKKQMSMKIAANVKSEESLVVRMMPLFIKNIVMKAIFDIVGERKSCLSLSNLGVIKVPCEMESYVERFDLILGAQASAPYNCGVVTFKNRMNVNFIRNIKESDFEYEFYRVLKEHGIPVKVQSNLR